MQWEVEAITLRQASSALPRPTEQQAGNREASARRQIVVAAAAQVHDTLQQFPERAYVRLRSEVHGGYFHADEDGVGVSLRWRRHRSVHAVWQVQRILHDSTTYVLLHSATYGRYLAVSPTRRRRGTAATASSRGIRRVGSGPHPVEAHRPGARRLRLPAPRLQPPPPRQPQ
uniref:DUF569 domain-containing protein n=1 Tax=Zea mays TaxID=4577 RepID=A0A804LSJ1_MAIZE